MTHLLEILTKEMNTDSNSTFDASQRHNSIHESNISVKIAAYVKKCRCEHLKTDVINEPARAEVGMPYMHASPVLYAQMQWLFLYQGEGGIEDRGLFCLVQVETYL